MERAKFILTAVFLMLITFSCQKETMITEDNEAITAQETTADIILADIDALTEEALGRMLLKSAPGTEGNYLGSCPVITTDRTVKPRVMTLDFGTGCTGKDGKVRSGKIIITSESLEVATFKRTKSFDNFFVEGRKVEGSIEKSITLDREDLTRVATVKEDITITFPENKGTVKRESEMTRTYKLNNAGNQRDDQIISVGTVVTIRSNGVKVTKTISDSDPLVFKVACHQLVAGTVTMESSDGRKWSVNYGEGACDNKAVVTSGDRTKEIHLK